MRWNYRVSKYDPDLRNSFGHYTGNEWTSFSQIGTVVSGRKVSIREYEQTEEAYILTIQELLDEAKVNELELRGFSALPRYKRELAGWKNKKTVSVKNIASICRPALREFLSVQLHVPRRAFVHFGFDYYVYMGLSMNTPIAIKAARKRGIFVEPFISPYRKLRNAAG